MARFFYFGMKINVFYFIFNKNYSKKKVFEYVINRLQHGTLVIALSINPRPISALELTLSGLIMGSRVDTAGDNQSPNVIISKYTFANFSVIQSDVTLYSQVH